MDSPLLNDGAREQLLILLADDSEPDLLLLSAILRQAGHRVILATNGKMAVSLFEEHRPDLVLLDVVMPELNGYQTARAIKHLAGDELVPVIFLTSLNDTPSLVRGLNAGGDDFLSKPYNSVVLTTKINALNRMRNLQRTVLQQKNLIEQHHERLLYEQTLAKTVFDKIAHTGCLDASNVRHSLSPLSVFNGDLAVAAYRPNGNMVLLLGDFTGHGLSAAMGALPLASTFYAMIPKGFGIADILFEINRKLHTTLPVGNFCCALILEINLRTHELQYWNGGLPEAVVFNERTGEQRYLRSTYLPLGVLSPREFRTKPLRLDCNFDEKIYLWTDGLTEAADERGEMFGKEKLQRIFSTHRSGEDVFETIRQCVSNFSVRGPDDDVSFIEIALDHCDLGQAVGPTQFEPVLRSGWRTALDLDHTSFSEVDPLSIMVNGLMEFKNLRNHQAEILAITSELYTNALEHGVLKLDSALKAAPGGFKAFYDEKKLRLASLTAGHIRFEFSLLTEGERGELKITVEDSGKGFDASTILLGGAKHSHQYAGRGLMLVNSLCETLEFLDKGNRVEATFVWSLHD